MSMNESSRGQCKSLIQSSTSSKREIHCLKIYRKKKKGTIICVDIYDTFVK